jgi:hypothetical protein
VRVRRRGSARPRKRNGFLSGLFKLLVGPFGMVALGIAIVLGVGFWARGSDFVGTPAAKSTTSPVSKPVDTAAPDPAPAPVPAPKPAPVTDTPAPPPTDQAMAQHRSRIDRSGGAAESMLVTVYYSDSLKNGLSLQPVEIQVPRSLSRIMMTAEQVVNPPIGLGLHSNVPDGTVVKSVNLSEGVATVDLTPEVETAEGSGAAINIMASFVFSLTEIEGVDAVRLWVNGYPATLPGIDWSQPITRAEIEQRNSYVVEPVIEYVR